MMLPKTSDGTITATTQDAATINLLGGITHGSVGLTKDQVEKLAKVYGFKINDLNIFENAGNQRNLLRHVERDGIRIMAFLSRYLEKGEDPVRLLQYVMIETGYDVPDLMEDEEEVEEDDTSQVVST